MVVRYKTHIFAVSIIKTNIMKKNTAILDTFKKTIQFNFNGEEFTVDLTEGDLEDSWNSVEMKNGDVFDTNFSWQECFGIHEKPAFSLYPVLPNGDGTWSADWSDDKGIKIVEVIGDYSQYYDDVPLEYNPNALPHKFEVFNGNNELQLKTKKFNLACDTAGSAEYLKKGTGWYVVAIDANGGRKNIG